MSKAPMSEAESLEKSIENGMLQSYRHKRCGNEQAAMEYATLANWLEELRLRRVQISALRDALDGVDMISKRDILKIIGDL